MVKEGGRRGMVGFIDSEVQVAPFKTPRYAPVSTGIVIGLVLTLAIPVNAGALL